MSQSSRSAPAGPQYISVWDLPVRLVHWAIAVCFVTLLVTVRQGWMQAHFYAGYSLAALIVFRLIWGVLGTRYARFSSFRITPKTLAGALRGLLRGETNRFAGHNPAGALMALILLGTLGLQVASGLVYSDDVFWFGPLYFEASETLQQWAALLHPRLPALLLALVALHILAVLYHRLRLREPLVAAMVHGRKPWHDPTAAREPIGVVRFLLALLPAVALFIWLAAITV